MNDDQRYAAILARDGAYDGVFLYAVRSTGVFCKPSCGARRAKRENVAFHRSVDEAIAAGFRPCKRCRPDQLGDSLHAEVVTAACRLIDEAIAADRPAPSLDALARRAGYSPYHLHRVFRKTTGITPRAYAAGIRANRVRRTLDEASTISQAILAAGYGSSSRFYEHSTQRLGMTPTRARQGGAGETIRFALGATSLGTLLVAATDKGVCAIELGDDPDQLLHALEHRFAGATLIGDDAGFADVVSRVAGLVESPAGTLDLPLDIRGTAFQQRVWAALTAIAPGRTVTYGELAAAIGQPHAVRAVASACAANALAVAIPCHRVVRATGEVSGYRWGVERKEALLRREGAR
jgi:AraC family transcriptional regulator of adaptative response/methylated-DNA-[protein]-cysteine methyltransferase